MRRAALCVVLLSLAGPAARGETVVAKEQWVEGMKTGLPVVFCQEGFYFRTCFRISAEECEETALSTTRVCLANFGDELPSVLLLPLEGQQWGQKIGACAGSTFELKWTERKVRSERCNDPSAWAGK